MKLFHGSNLEIDNVNLTLCRPYKDFGRGSYLTQLKDQATKMGYRVAKIYGGMPCITEFEVPDNLLSLTDLNVKYFAQPSVEWATFVINNHNRHFNNAKNSDSNQDNRYDLVAGPVANDDLALLFRQFSNGMITADILLKEMQYKQLTNQYSFHTQKAISYLNKAGIIHD